MFVVLWWKSHLGSIDLSKVDVLFWSAFPVWDVPQCTASGNSCQSLSEQRSRLRWGLEVLCRPELLHPLWSQRFVLQKSWRRPQQRGGTKRVGTASPKPTSRRRPHLRTWRCRRRRRLARLSCLGSWTASPWTVTRHQTFMLQSHRRSGAGSFELGFCGPSSQSNVSYCVTALAVASYVSLDVNREETRDAVLVWWNSQHLPTCLLVFERNKVVEVRLAFLSTRKPGSQTCWPGGVAFFF